MPIFGNDYTIALDGGTTIAVTPIDEPPTSDSHVWLYHKPTKTWKGKHHIQDVIAHGNYWTEPDTLTIIRIPGPSPS